MKKKGITGLLWVSLGIDAVYMVLLLFFIIFQKPIQTFYTAWMDEEITFSAPFLAGGDVVFFMIHICMTVILLRQRSEADSSISKEVTGAVMFGGGLFWLLSIWDRLSFHLVGRFKGDYWLAGLSIFRNSTMMIAPIRMVAATLFLLAVGMSIYRKRSYREEKPDSQRLIAKLLWGSLGLDVLFFVIMAAVVVFQNQLKPLIGAVEIEFALPVMLIATYTVLLAPHILLTIMFVNQLKRGSRIIVFEILSILLYGGLLSWPYMLLDRLELIRASRAGITAVVNLSGVNTLIGFCAPIRTIGISLLLLCCGMMICRKSA